MDDLRASAVDCLAQGARAAQACAFDARDTSSFGSILEQACAQDGVINCAVFVGSMPTQDAIDADPDLITGTVQDNFTGPATFLQMLAPELENRGSGTVVGVGSVAGDRGRIGNYVYGSAKAGFATYLSGLRNRLTRAGGHVVTVKPGFVDTAMTWDVEGMFLVAAPEQVASDILKAVAKKKNVIYTPFFWRYIMLIIRNIPEFIFKKMSI
jgi:short-subunit dehydrogenase